MKRIVSLTIALLLLTGCAAKAPAEVSPTDAKALVSAVLDSQGEGENKTAVSEEKVISYIRELVGREKPENPLSDEEVTQRLNGQYGLKIERRTVTKYRIKAGIGSSRERKRKA